MLSRHFATYILLYRSYVFNRNIDAISLRSSFHVHLIGALYALAQIPPILGRFELIDNVNSCWRIYLQALRILSALRRILISRHQN